MRRTPYNQLWLYMEAPKTQSHLMKHTPKIKASRILICGTEEVFSADEVKDRIFGTHKIKQHLFNMNGYTWNYKWLKNVYHINA